MTSTYAGGKCSTMNEDGDIGDRWEVGSEFHWDEGALVDAGVDPPVWLPVPHAIFTSGSGALISLITQLHGHARLRPPRVVTEMLSEQGVFVDLARWEIHKR